MMKKLKKVLIFLMFIQIIFVGITANIVFGKSEIKNEMTNDIARNEIENQMTNDALENESENATKLEDVNADKSTEIEVPIKNNDEVEKNLDNEKKESNDALEVQSAHISRIIEGTYIIQSALDNNKVLDVENGDTSNCTNVRIWQNRNVFQQQFEMEYNAKDDTYVIRAKCSGKVLDVANGGKTNGTNVWQYETNGTVAQQWILKDAGDGYYYIVSKCNGLYLDIEWGSTANGTNIQLYEGNGTKAQKFKFIEAPKTECEKLVSEGTYYITTALSENKAIRVANGNDENCANVNLFDKKNIECEKFKLVYNSKEKNYIISIPFSNKVIDVANGGKSNCSNAWQYESNGTVAQQWILRDAGDGYYYIVSKCNGLYLDIEWGSTVNGANIQLYEGNGTKAQKFKFEKTDGLNSYKTINDGKYYIHTIINNKTLNGSGSLIIGDTTNFVNVNQRFNITYNGNGYYKVMSLKSGKYLSAKQCSYENGAKIVFEEKNSSTRQDWIIEKNGEGYNIKSRYNGLVFDIPSGNATNGVGLQLYESNNTKAQKFNFEQINDQSKKILEDGVYTISTALDWQKVLDVSGGSYDNCANVQIWGNGLVQQQKFQVTYNSDGMYYEIICANSGKVLDVAYGGKTNGSNVWQYESNGTVAQQWILQDAGDGYFYIMSKGSLLYLDVAGGNRDNGANIQIYEGNGTNAQKFRFTEVRMLNDNLYNVALKNNLDKHFDIRGGSTEENTALQVWQKEDVNQQRFEVKYIDNKYCKIVAKHSDMALTAVDGKVVQVPYQDLKNQQWSIETAGNGFYKIRLKNSNQCMTISRNSSNNGTEICLSNNSNASSQAFKFINIIERKGIDVSTWNGIINWRKVKETRNVDFTIIRAAYRGYRTGKIVTDLTFKQNYDGAKENGIDIGLYFFSQAVTPEEAVEEANYVLDLIKKYNVDVKYPIFIDTEWSGADNKDGRADNLDVNTRTKVCNEFVRTINNAGYTGGIYASMNWYYEKLDVAQLNSGEIWVAQYTSNPKTDYKYRYNIWQYTSEGSINGILGNVDIDICYKVY